MPSPARDLMTAVRAGRFPLVGPAIAFGAGCVLSALLGHPNTGIWFIIPCCFAVLLLSLVFRNWKAAIVRQRLGIAILVFFGLVGFWRSTSHHAPNRSDFFQTFLVADNTATLLVKIGSIRPGERSLRLETTVQALVDSVGRRKVSGKLLLYLPADKRTASLQSGDELLLNGSVQVIDSPKNPYAFDAQKYWAGQGVHHRMYLKEGNAWQLVATAPPGIKNWASKLRIAWQNSFRKYLTGNELAVASALVLGKKDLLTEELRNAYADTGAVHVLAVSGLHVGIVSLLIGGFLGLFPWRSFWWRLLSVSLTIGGIWGFAMLTGGSSSVIRAATMFSILALGGLGRRKIHLFNLLAFAALLILIVDPKQIMQLGFQLSFAAVVGIGLFQKWLTRLLASPYTWLNKISAALSVSMAATLGTLPFCLFYFHQFPLYFLLTGTLVVYSAFAILLLGILHGFVALVFSKLSFLTGTLLNFVVELQNTIVFLGRQLPGARQETAWISGWEFGLLALAIVLLGWWLRRRDFAAIALVMSCLFGCAFLGWQSSKVRKEQELTIVYNHQNERVVDVVQGKHAIRLVTRPLDPDQLRYVAGNNQRALDYTIDTTLVLPSTKEYRHPGLAEITGNYLFTAQGIWLLKGALDPSFPVDFAFPETAENVDNENGVTTWIIDGKMRRYEAKKIRERTGKYGAKTLYFTAELGAFVAR